MKEYVRATKAYPWLLPSFEESLGNAADGTVSDVSKLSRGFRGPVGRPISKDETLVALNALCDLQVFERVGLRYRFNKARFDATEEMRMGVRAALEVIDDPTR